MADSATAGSISPGVHQCVGDIRDAPGISGPRLRRPFRGPPRAAPSERDEYSHRPVECGAAAAGVHRRGRRELLQRARDDDDQRQHHHFAHRGFHRHDSALRHEHGLSLQPDRAARAARRGGLRRAAFLVGRAREHGQLAQSHVRWRMGRVRQRASARLDARSDIRRGREPRADATWCGATRIASRPMA